MLSLNAKAALAKCLDEAISRHTWWRGRAEMGAKQGKAKGAKTEMKLSQLVSAFFNKVNATTPCNDVRLFHSFVLLSLLLCCCLSSSSSQRLCFIFVLVYDRCFTASFRSNHDNVREENEKTNDDPSQESLKVC